MPVIVEYDPCWPTLFDEEKARLGAATGALFVAIEHSGSTAVPGLAAKPIIDIMGGVQDLREVGRHIPALEGLGYEYVQQYEIEIPERRYFRKPQGPARHRTHHLHIVETTSSFWRRHLLFRDYLRTHPAVAESVQILRGNSHKHMATMAEATRMPRAPSLKQSWRAQSGKDRVRVRGIPEQDVKEFDP